MTNFKAQNPNQIQMSKHLNFDIDLSFGFCNL